MTHQKVRPDFPTAGEPTLDVPGPPPCAWQRGASRLIFIRVPNGGEALAHRTGNLEA
jgi:hypothetical protein